MVLTLDKFHLDASFRTFCYRVVVAATLAGWMLLAGLIASLYVGHSPSPYGTCTTANGRSVACSLLKR
jgi:hypothetical protein